MAISIIVLFGGISLISAELLIQNSSRIRRAPGYGGDTDDGYDDAPRNYAQNYGNQRPPPNVYSNPQQGFSHQRQPPTLYSRPNQQTLYTRPNQGNNNFQPQYGSQGGYNLPNGQPIQSLYNHPVNQHSQYHHQQQNTGYSPQIVQGGGGYNQPIYPPGNQQINQNQPVNTHISQPSNPPAKQPNNQVWNPPTSEPPSQPVDLPNRRMNQPNENEFSSINLLPDNTIIERNSSAPIDRRDTMSNGGNRRTSTNNQNKGSNEEDERPVWGSKDSSNSNTQIRNPGAQNPTTSATLVDSVGQKSISRIMCEKFCLLDTVGMFPTPKPVRLARPGEQFFVGGENAHLYEYPHMAALGFNTPGKEQDWNSCGGALISEEYILTAAHCCDSDLGKPTIVRLGDLDLYNDKDGANHVDIEVAEVILMPYYETKGQIYHDLALLRLARKVDFQENIKPACLYDDMDIKETSAMATGWGKLGFVEQGSPILQKGSLDIIPNEECRKYRPPERNFAPRGLVPAQLCAGVLAGGRDTCLGDSGGPLQINNTHCYRQGGKCPPELIGILSYGGQNCGNKNSPGVFTRVSSYTTWIESIVWPGQFSSTNVISSWK